MVTLVAVYLLILVGGIVRSTGSGMGCPDWPKCFGTWIPPTDVSELPDTYKADYVNYRKAKNEKFANYLTMFGFSSKAEQILGDKSILEETEFNITKTWIEYINRVLGAIIGFLIILTLIGSIPYLKGDRLIFYMSLGLFFLVLFQGWIGSVVVSTNLLPWMITLHMILAVIMVAILIFLVFRSRQDDFTNIEVRKKKLINFLLISSGALIFIQIIFGTQVRESIDVIAAFLNYDLRETWIEELGLVYYIHRSFSVFILLYQLGILYILFKNKLIRTGFLNYANVIMVLLTVEVALGVIMAYYGIPPFAQPIHLLFAIIILGMQFLFLLVVNNKDKNVSQKSGILT